MTKAGKMALAGLEEVDAWFRGEEGIGFRVSVPVRKDGKWVLETHENMTYEEYKEKFGAAEKDEGWGG